MLQLYNGRNRALQTPNTAHVRVPEQGDPEQKQQWRSARAATQA